MYMYTYSFVSVGLTQARPSYTVYRLVSYSFASVGVTQARPSYTVYRLVSEHTNQATHWKVTLCQQEKVGLGAVLGGL